MTTTDARPPMHVGERADAYTRRTGNYPPHWTADRCAVQDARIRDYEQVAAMGCSPQDRAAARRYLRRWDGLAND